MPLVWYYFRLKFKVVERVSIDQWSAHKEDNLSVEYVHTIFILTSPSLLPSQSLIKGIFIHLGTSCNCIHQHVHSSFTLSKSSRPNPTFIIHSSGRHLHIHVHHSHANPFMNKIYCTSLLSSSFLSFLTRGFNNSKPDDDERTNAMMIQTLKDLHKRSNKDWAYVISIK